MDPGQGATMEAAQEARLGYLGHAANIGQSLRSRGSPTQWASKGVSETRDVPPESRI